MELKDIPDILKISENRFSSYFHSSPDGIAITDKSGKYVMVNSSLCNLLGYTEDELLQLKVKDVDKSEHFHILIKTGESKGEVELIKKDGNRVCVDIHAVGLEDGCNLALLRDSTDRKKAEIALMSEVKLNTVLAELSHMFLSTTEVERIASVLLEQAVQLTESQCGYNGYVDPKTGIFTISNLSGDEIGFRGLWGWVLENKKPLLTNHPAEVYRAAGVPAGHIPIGRFLSVPVLIDNLLVGQISVGNSKRDYTNQDLKILERLADIYAIALQRKHAEQKIRESEQQYDLIINGINDAVMLYEVVEKEHFRFLKGNNTLLKMLGITEEELAGKLIHDVVPKEIADVLVSFNRQAVCSKRLVLEEVHVPHVGTYEAKYIPVIDSLGECSHLIVVAQDMSERKKAEEHLLKIQKLESVGILAGGIAHDFNNILTAITGNVSLAKLKLSKMSSPGADTILNLLGEAERASLEAKNLTQQLLTFAKGGTPILKTTSISELLKETTEFALRGSNVKCMFDIPEYVWAVKVDEGQINQVIHNLIRNADEAMPNGGKVEIKVENTVITAQSSVALKDGNYVRILIRDDGLGIPPEFVDKIFDPYFSTKQRGSGLGLTTSYSILRKHAGLLEVESEFGKGTTFELYLPAADAIVVNKKQSSESLAMGNGKILVMDDEEMLRFMLKEMLHHLGYEAACAKDGDEAITMYANAQKQNEPFDAAIMDLTIPGGMGGKEAIAKLKEMDPEVAAIVSSGYSNDPVMSEYRKYGFKDVVTKPYSIEELTEVLRKVIYDKKPQA